MSSQKRITIAACAMFIMLGFLGGGILKTKKESPEPKTASDEVFASAETDIVTETDTEYTLKIQDGILAVFAESDETRPIIVTDIYASTLRHFDRERLTEGIVVKGDLEMQKLLEDFSS
ncbi:MAG: hypothetical protein IKM21_05875 [Oscillospiraceae bacterium]|nr:hypothetical protein [Oscillospiraceae bacterium]